MQILNIILPKKKPSRVSKFIGSVCLQCENVFNKRATVTKFCSSNCHNEYKWKQRILRIEQSGVCDQSNVVARKYLIEKYGHKCQICNTAYWNEKPIPLVLDHINGNSTDWRLTELRIICCNCDAQTPFYKAKNKGNGRHLRRQRYADGKSY